LYNDCCIIVIIQHSLYNTHCTTIIIQHSLYNTLRKMSVWGPSPPPILQIHSLHQVSTVTASHVPLRRRGIIISIFRGSGTNCMVPTDWDLAPKCVCGPDFISYLVEESPILSAARISRLLKIIFLFCKRDLQNRPYSAKETYHFKKPIIFRDL